MSRFKMRIFHKGTYEGFLVLIKIVSGILCMKQVSAGLMKKIPFITICY